ncbi:MAG: hypothetical protein ABIZ70_13505 [Gemmatimonadales bacterium]
MKPDPWAVVDFHAQAAARGTADERMTSEQRLVLYAAAAPEVIGATRITSSDAHEWWSAPVAGSPNTLIWNNAGEIFLGSASSARVRRWVVGVFVGALVFAPLGPEVELLGLIPAVLLGVGASLVVQRYWPAWARYGNVHDGAGAHQAMEAFVARYERDVPALPTSEPE